jgi:hypothetical protein
MRNVEVEFTFNLHPDHPDWPEVTWCQTMISENDFPLDKATIRGLRITPRALKEVFAEARELAKDIKPGDRTRVVADRLWRGQGYGRSKDDFLVAVSRYSPTSDPMLQEVKGVVQ